ncbi:hypothetical protein KG088_10775 [Halomonas sp. TRM85114]|uniref:helix-hairpin-helix domain-containing protein n=1 Tax=Halomonas jincaotanensis TaxID=2810616 RepID=UPI001BD57FC7|nr:helix-hairpin-helix domain-containing protein [Halomonas jincaotanensis]MBS9404114.1 hypothetical protein [Halomonas jincaotanensis]
MHETEPTTTREHTIALELKALAQQAREALITALESDPPAAITALESANDPLTRIGELAHQHDFINLPVIDDVQRDVDRLACSLYRQGACDSLDQATRSAFVDRHAKALTAQDGIGPVSARKLFAHGISDLEQLRALGPDGLDSVEGLSAATLARIKANI